MAHTTRKWAGRVERRTPSPGFSLIELIVVLAILAAAAALALPQANGALNGASLESTAVQLAATLRLVRADVIRSSQDRSLTLDLDQKAYWSDADPKRRLIGPRITMSVRDDTFEWAGRTRRIRFWPDGSATGGLIILSDGVRQVLVNVDWLTGVTSVKVER